MNKAREEPDDEHTEGTVSREDQVLQDVAPYCSDPDFVRKELSRAKRTEDPMDYLERRSGELTGSRKGDIRILMNRLARSRR